MDKQKQRIAIAEACGWKFLEHHIGKQCYVQLEAPTGQYVGSEFQKNLGLLYRYLPDYLKDLNVMHEAENNQLRPTPNDNAMQRDEKFVRWDNYIEFLSSKMGKDDIAHATADQRAEAFLRTIGKWED